MDINKEVIAKNIKKIRTSHGLTMEQFGDLFDAHKSLVSKWEKGMSAPSRERLQKICDYANISLPEIMGISLEEKVRNYYLNIMYGEYDLFYSYIENDEDFFNKLIMHITNLNIKTEEVNYEIVKEAIFSLILKNQSNLNDLETFRINELSKLISQQKQFLNDLSIKLNVKEYDPEMIRPALSDLEDLKIDLYSITENINNYLTQDINNIINDKINHLVDEYNVEDYETF